MRQETGPINARCRTTRGQRGRVRNVTTRSYDDSSVASETRPASLLIRAFQCSQLGAPPELIELAFGTELSLGRGVRSPSSAIEEGRLVARLETEDEWMSASHAFLSCDSGEWMVRDAGSKNGTFVNGDQVDRAVLVDGDHLRLGSTIFVFRRDATGEQPETLDPHLALRTVHWPLHADITALRKVAPTTVPIVIRGETGTGKEVLARCIHELSGRDGPFVAVNCGAIPATLVESELFGFKKGTFSGADRDALGLVRASDRGTLFLDEIAELSTTAQITLLRILQEREVRPIGSTSPISIDLRVVAATHQDLALRVAEGTFREDLYSRLVGVVAVLPPLRDRMEDLGALIAGQLRELAPERVDELRFTRDGADMLFRHDWPRNIRELRSVLEVAVATVTGHEIGPKDLRIDASSSRRSESTRAVSAGDRRDAVIESLRANNGNVSRAARALGYSRAHFHRLMKTFSVEASSFRA